MAISVSGFAVGRRRRALDCKERREEEAAGRSDS